MNRVERIRKRIESGEYEQPESESRAMLFVAGSQRFRDDIGAAGQTGDYIGVPTDVDGQPPLVFGGTSTTIVSLCVLIPCGLYGLACLFCWLFGVH